MSLLEDIYCKCSSRGWGGGVLPYIGLRGVPWDRVWFLRFPILKQDIIFVPVGILFSV